LIWIVNFKSSRDGPASLAHGEDWHRGDGAHELWNRPKIDHHAR
jgi:hypothetical protein